MRFDANVGAGLPWKFAPEKNQIEARLGDVVTVDYIVTNLVARETHGVAGYNVAPLNLGAYFQKINCFCFTDQTMKPGETRAMTVVFYVDPALANDPDGQGDLTMTLVLHLLSATRAAAAGRGEQRSGPAGTNLGSMIPKPVPVFGRIMLNVKSRRRSRPMGIETENDNGWRANQASRLSPRESESRGRWSARSRPSCWRSARSPGCTRASPWRRWCSPPACSACSTP